MGTRITVVGAGSTYTPELVEGFARRSDRLRCPFLRSTASFSVKPILPGSGCIPAQVSSYYRQAGMELARNWRLPPAG